MRIVNYAFFSRCKTFVAISLLALPVAQGLAASDSEPKTGLGLKLIAEGFVSPTVLTPLDDGSGRLLIADQVGTIHILNPDGKLSEDLFLDLKGRLCQLNEGFDERGVLGLALHPKFRQNRKLYVYYSAPLRKEMPTNWNHTSHVSEFKVTEKDSARVDPASERVLLQIDEPQFNHNCGRILFGPDGYLYIGLGDGGQANDTGVGHAPEGNGQNLSTLLGKILRIDVDKGDPYSVPPDNPFVGTKARPEIFAYGLRNPWGISFDRGGTREMFAADVGQDRFEEVNLIVKGGNYGWRIREAFSCFDPNNPTRPPEDCPEVGADGKPLLPPILAYKSFRSFPQDPEAKGISVTGGYVYRGKALPQLTGSYVFADWSKNWALPMGVLFVATRPAGGTTQWTLETLELASHPRGIGAYVVAFGEDADGELYVLTNGRNSLTSKTGKVFKLAPM
jgi:glucose/arabinose dehydrogenase